MAKGRSKEYQIGEYRCQGIPTGDLETRELWDIRDFRVNSYAAALPNTDRTAVERYVDRGMDVWANPNKGVDRGTLRRGQIFGKPVVWLARGNDGSVAGEVLSANNASSKREGIEGDIERAAKMRFHALPVRRAGRIVLEPTPFRAIREMCGPADVVAPLVYMTAKCEARPTQPMSAYAWDEEDLSAKIPEWGFKFEGSEEISPVGKGGALVTELSFRAPSARVVAETIFASSDGVRSSLWNMHLTGNALANKKLDF